MARCVPLAFAASLFVAAPAEAGTSGWGTASDIGRDGLVIVALGLPAVQSDWKGTKEAAFSVGSVDLVTEALKQTIHEERPDGSDDKSFPSGHTSVSFAAAATIYKRSGWQVGIPAHLVAAFVGVARVRARKHFTHDVIAGAAIGEAGGWIFTSRGNEKVRWLPWGDAHGAGLALTARF